MLAKYKSGESFILLYGYYKSVVFDQWDFSSDFISDFDIVGFKLRFNFTIETSDLNFLIFLNGLLIVQVDYDIL